MATLSNVQFTPSAIANNPNQVKVTVKYTLTPTNVEKLAGSVFNETIQLWGDDGIIDQLRFTAPGGAQGQFAVGPNTPTVNRTRTFTVAKSAMNEDSQVTATGSELGDEMYAKVSVAYIANPPNPPPAITPAMSAVLNGVWK